MTINTQRLRRIGHAVELELGRESGLIIQQAADEIDAQAVEIARLREALRIAVGALDNAADHSPTGRCELRFHANAVRAALRETCHD